MGSSDEWSEFQEIIDSTPELDPRVYGGGNRYELTSRLSGRDKSFRNEDTFLFDV